MTNRRKRAYSSQTILIALVLALILPVLIFAGVVLSRVAETERSRYQDAALDAARRIASIVDQELSGLQRALQVLATSRLIDARDYARLYEQALEVKALLGADVLIKDASGQQLVNTRLPWGTALPVSLPEGDRQALETRQPVVSDLFIGATSQRPIVSINVPIMRHGSVWGLVNVGIDPDRFAALLRSQGFPGAWTSALVDRSGRIIARSRQHEQFVGATATQDLRERAIGPEGTWVGTTVEGTAVLSAYTRSALSGWRAAVGVPVAIVEAPLRASMFWLVGLSLIGLTGAMVTAGWWGRQVARALRELASSATSLADTGTVHPPLTKVREVNEIGEALTRAAADLRDRTVSRDIAEATLREETERLDTLNRTGQTIAGELDLQTVVQKVTDAGVSLSGAAFGAFFYNVVNEEGELYTLYTISGVPREAFSKFPMPRKTQVFGPTFNGEGIVRSNDITKDPRYGQNQPYNGMPEGHLPVRSYLAIPVRSRSGEIIGGLFFGHPDPSVFQDSHEHLLTGIAAQAAIAIDNARLYDAAQREIEERRRAEDNLRSSEEQFRTLANSIPQLAWMADSTGARHWFNERWTEFTGLSREQSQGWGWQKAHHPDHVERVTAAIRRCFGAGEPWEDTFPLRSRSGNFRWFLSAALPIRDERGNIVRWFGTNTDITDRQAAEEALREFSRRLEAEVDARTRELQEANTRLISEIQQREKVEEQLRQAQKMEAVGQLTGGIAHDFNNLLAVISGSLEMMRRRLDRGEIGAVPRYLDSASEGARRAATLTHRLLAFSRQQALAPEPLDANKLVAGMSDLLRRTLGEHINIETVLAGGLWRTHADPNHLEHAIINLAVNARDAMPDGGNLTIETANCHLDEHYANDNIGASPGQYVLVAVTDTGAGMPPEVISKAFDPFFTTKPTGQGTGLGLSQVYGFVRQSGGHVKIYSEPGHGTTVKIYLPRFFGTITEKVRAEATKAVPISDGQQTVLVVEDEPAVRGLSVETLRELGYRVFDAESAVAALRVLDTDERIDVLFTDVVMPDVNGRKLADEALRRRPGLKVLFTTGYTRNAVVHNGVLDAGVHLIVKPFTIEQLALKLHEVISERNGFG